MVFRIDIRLMTELCYFENFTICGYNCKDFKIVKLLPG